MSICPLCLEEIKPDEETESIREGEAHVVCLDAELSKLVEEQPIVNPTRLRPSNAEG